MDSKRAGVRDRDPQPTARRLKVRGADRRAVAHAEPVRRPDRREVCAHLVPPEGGYEVLRVLWDVVRFRGDLARMVDVTTREQARQPTTDLVASLRERAGERLKAPVVGPQRPMVATAIHLRDAARRLALDTCPPLQDWRQVLDFLVSRPAGLCRRRPDG